MSTSTAEEAYDQTGQIMAEAVSNPTGDSLRSRRQVRLAYAHLNLRRNPFGELGRSERARLAVADVEPLVRRLCRPGCAVQLLGESGRGKTSLLLAIHRSFPEAAYVFVREQERVSFPHSHPLFIDEAHFLTPRQRRRVLSRPVSFVLSSHEDLEGELLEIGLETLTLRPAELLTPQLLEAAVARRIEASRRAPGPLPHVPPATIEKLIARFADDVRAMERCLYRRFQELEEVEDVSL